MTSYIYDLPPSPHYTVEDLGHRHRSGKRRKDGILHKTTYCTCVCFVGTASTLIATGLVEAHMFPGQPGRNKVMQRFPPLSDDYKDGIIIQRLSRIAFEVRVPFTRDEVIRRRDAWLNERAAKIEVRVDATPPKEEGTTTRTEARKSVNAFLRIIRTCLVDEADNLIFDDATVCQIEQLASEMEALLKDDEQAEGGGADSKPDSRVTAARNDQQLQSFLHAAAHNTSLVAGENQEGL